MPGLKSTDEKEELASEQLNNLELTDNTNNMRDRACTINDLSSGLLGKIEILKSGKARLRLGENYLDVSAGTRFSAFQVNCTSKHLFINYNGYFLIFVVSTENLYVT